MNHKPLLSRNHLKILSVDYVVMKDAKKLVNRFLKDRQAENENAILLMDDSSSNLSETYIEQLENLKKSLGKSKDVLNSKDQ